MKSLILICILTLCFDTNAKSMFLDCNGTINQSGASLKINFNENDVTSLDIVFYSSGAFIQGVLENSDKTNDFINKKADRLILLPIGASHPFVGHYAYVVVREGRTVHVEMYSTITGANVANKMYCMVW